jgi:hypothetical protein
VREPKEILLAQPKQKGAKRTLRPPPRRVKLPESKEILGESKPKGAKPTSCPPRTKPERRGRVRKRLESKENLRRANLKGAERTPRVGKPQEATGIKR